jgi:GNAT superfamily N-acetyltransferase
MRVPIWLCGASLLKGKMEFIGKKQVEIDKKPVQSQGIRFSITENGTEIGRAYLYFMHNDLHDRPFGLMEDVYIDADYRGQGIGSMLVKQVIEAAKHANCYKLIATSRLSRPKVHALYEKLGFVHHGAEFRINF